MKEAFRSFQKNPLKNAWKFFEVFQKIHEKYALKFFEDIKLVKVYKISF